MIRFSDFSFTYASQANPTLQHIDLEIKDGEKVLIIGPSGSGKSTLGNAINGLIPHAMEGKIEGSLKVGGLETKDSDIFELSQKVGTVFQDTDGQFVGLSVAEDVAFSLENQCMPTEKMKKVVLDTTALVEMQDYLDQSPNELSGGQKQRVSIAGVLVDEVDILLFDEPLANLDPATGETAIRLIDRLHRQTGKTIIIIEHRLEDVLICPVDRIVLVENGKITLNTDTETLLRSNALKEAGIREPLYISALKMAGCNLSQAKGKLSPIENMDVNQFKDDMASFFESHKIGDNKNENDAIISFNNVFFSYDGQKDVLKDISFTIRKGEMCALLGKNGAGKSTIAQLLTGILKPDSGNITVDGMDTDGLGITDLSSKIGYVMQNPNHMISHSLIYDEVAFALRQKGINEEEIKKKVLSTLELCGLRKHYRWPISALSYGQKKRVTIASILVSDPEVLILDEPTAGQDYRHYTALMKFIGSLNKKLGITIIFVTHDMHLALEYTSRAIVISDGDLLRDGEISQVFADKDLMKKANLKVTSLYTLCRMLSMQSDAPSFIRTFIHKEDEGETEKDVIRFDVAEKSSFKLIENSKKKEKREKSRQKDKEKKKYGFGLSYIEMDSPIHSLNGVTKFLSLLVWLVLCLTTFDLRVLLGSFALAIAVMLLSKIPFRRFVPLMCIMLFMITVNALAIFLFSPDQGSYYIGSRTIILGNPDMHYALSLETLIYLITVCLKYFTIFPIALVFVFATHPSEFASSLNRLKLSYRISYAVALTLRYIPEITDDFRHIMNAQMARGVDISKNVKLAKRISNVSKVLGPLLLSSLDRIDTISNAMVLRGFGKNRKKRTWYMSRKMRAADYLAIFVMLAILSTSFILRFYCNIMFYYPF